MTNKPKEYEFDEVVFKCWSILKNLDKKLGWKDVGTVYMALLNFQEKCGKPNVSALARYIDYALKHKKTISDIATTIAHDLNGAGSDCFCPRSNKY
jgi:hypothetical protein